MVDRGPSTRSHAGAWRALHAEGILWDGPVTVTGAGSELPLRLIVTTRRLAFTKGGSFVLDVPRDWLTPAPFLNTQGGINLSIDTGEGHRPERMRVFVRDGRGLIGDLLSGLVSPLPEGLPPASPIAVMNEPEEQPAPPPARLNRPARRAISANDSVSALDGDDFPPLAEQPARSRVIVIDDDLPPAQATGYFDAGSREPNWALEPIGSMSSRSSRHARRSWAIRLSGLVVLLTFAAAFGTGRLPSIPGTDIAGRLPATSIDAPFSSNEPTEPAQVAQAVAPTATTAAPVITPPDVESAQPTIPASETAIALGVGGMDGTLTATVPQTPTATATATSEPTATIEPTSTVVETTPEVQAAATEEPAPEPTATTVPPSPTLEPTAEPTSTPTVEPSPTQEPTAVPTQEPTVEPTTVPTQEPTTEPTVVPTLEPTQEPTLEPTTIPTLPPATEPPSDPTATSTTTPTNTPGPTATATATATPSPTSTPTVEPTFPAQPSSIAEGELPAQAFSGGQFRYTVESASRGDSIDSVALTAVSSGQWVMVMIHAQNWSETAASLSVGNFQLVTYGDFGVAGAVPHEVTGVIATTLGMSPTLGATDATVVAPGEGIRFVAVYLINPGTTVLQLSTGESTIALDPSLGQPIDVFNPGEPPAAPDLIEARVVDIIDGGAVIVKTADGAKARIQYLGVQAPEADACYGPEAAAANEALVLGKTVFLERERKNQAGKGRITRDVWFVKDNGEMTLASAELAALGAVVPQPVEPDIRYVGWIAAAGDAARANGAGLWGACGGLLEPPAEEVAADGAAAESPAVTVPVTDPTSVPQVVEPAVIRWRFIR